MALVPIARAAQTARQVYRDVTTGRFISKAAYQRQQRSIAARERASKQFRDPRTGRFKTGRLSRDQAEGYFEQRLGRPPPGGWVRIAFKYRERFEDYISGFEQEFGL